MAVKTDFDPLELIERAIASNLDAGVFDAVDDRHIKRAANWLEWCVGEEFLAMRPGPFPKQIEIAIKFFGDYCPRCSTKGYIDKLFDQTLPDIRANVCLLEHGVCPKCKVTQTELFLKKELGEHEELDLCLGRRSGKTVIASMIATYHLHRILSLRDPASYYNLLQNQTLHMLFVAPVKGQAEDTVWQAFRDRMDGAPWFKSYHAWLDETSKKNRSKALYDLKETYIWYGHKRLVAQLVSANVKTSRGRTTVFCVDGDTRIATADGLQRIRDVCGDAKDGFTDKKIELLTENGTQTTSHVYVSPASTVKTITTNLGYSLTGTMEHPIRVLEPNGTRVWKPITDVQVGDVAVLCRRGLFSEKYVTIDVEEFKPRGPHHCYTMPTVIDEDLGWFLGIMVAEGNVFTQHLPIKGGYGMFTGDDEIRDRVLEVTARLFGKAATARKMKDRPNGWHISCQSPLVAACLTKIGFGGIAATKKIPEYIFRSPKAVIANFIGGYFDGDSFAGAKEITATSLSRELIAGVQQLLLLFGIKSKLYTAHRNIPIKKNGKVTHHEPRAYSLLRVYGEDIDKFHDCFKMYCPRKDLRHDIVRVAEHVPITDWYLCTDGIVRQLGMVEELGLRTRSTQLQLTRVDTDNLRQAAPALAANIEEIRSRSDLFYDKIVDVSTKDNVVTYDVTVPGDHSFISNGFVSHNTGIDEASWIDGGAEDGGILSNAQETHNSLAQSNQSVRAAAMKLRKDGVNFVPTGVDLNISSPASANDIIMRMIRSSRDNPLICAFHLPTWEVNPNVPYDALTRERLQNPKAFLRDFGAVPPMADSAFMEEEKLVARASLPGKQNILSWNIVRERDPVDPTFESMWLKVLPKSIDKTTPRILGIDPGESNNSFALTLASWHHESQTVQFDGVLECQPEKQTDGTVTKVNFPRMFDQCVVPILESFNVRLVVSDHWQSSDLRQRIRSDQKIAAESYTLKFDDFLAIRTAWYDGRVNMPATERPFEDSKKTSEQLDSFVRGLPVLKFLMQAMMVREVGRRILKPAGMSDDIFRAGALCIKYLTDPELNRPFIYSTSSRSGGNGSSRTVGRVRSNRDRVSPGQGTSSKVGTRRSRLDPAGISSPKR